MTHCRDVEAWHTVADPVKDQPVADMRDDKTVITTADHNNIPPLPSLAHSILCPASDRCDTTDLLVSPWRRSVPVIRRFNPVMGWWTILQLLTSRAAKSIAFSVLNRNALLSRAEDGLLVQPVVKYSTPNVLTHAHRSIGYRNQTQPLAESAVRLMYLCPLVITTKPGLWLNLSRHMTVLYLTTSE